MKLIAFYLPQFHEIPENNQWWGEGFTEWKTVSLAKPVFRGHEQPKVPKNQNYYHLLEKKVMKKQSQQAMEAGIDAFCMYHYWFNGRKILEKPAENYLKWKDIKTEFCFSWANESWTRTWTTPDGNNWYAENFGEQIKNEKDRYLIKQEYGTEENWKEHFMYLLPFFKDSRYLKKENKPVFLIYKPDSIPCLLPMMKFFQKLARENGFQGIHFVLTNPTKEYGRHADAYVMYEPSFTLRKDLPQFYRWRDSLIDQDKIKHRGIKKYSFSIFWLKNLMRKTSSEKTVYSGAFCGYDDTPRRSDRGMVYQKSSPFKFFLFLTALLLKKKKTTEDMIFITAWNEWSEGAYLEPDQNYGYGFLKAVKKARWISRC